MQNYANSTAPLAERMRPRTIDEVIGQQHIIGKDTALGSIIRSKSQSIPSMIFVGPPGVGKTTLAKVIAKQSSYRFIQLSGVLDGVKEVRNQVKIANDELKAFNKKTLALVDEIHRFNKAQQDAFLPYVESGILTVIGQTTENVSFRVRNALLSRMRVIELEPLNTKEIEEVLRTALNDEERGLGSYKLEIDNEAIELISHYSSGDARRALNALEWSSALTNARSNKTDKKIITKDLAKEAFGNQPQLFDQDGDYHYDNISAFIKSMRGSDPDAALYYMLKALESGEDPHYLTRRMIIFASEDASCDPRALQVAINADQALERIGLPEGRISMAQAAVYLACCSKSNASYKAMKEWLQIIEQNPNLPVPKRLKNAPTDLMRQMGNSQGYKYPHDYPDAFIPESYLPMELHGVEVYQPTSRGLDKLISERLEIFREKIKKEKANN